MTTKQIEKLLTQASKFGMTFEPEFFSREQDVKFVIRWARKEKADRDDVRAKLEKLGCHSIEHLQSKSGFDQL